MRSDIDGIPLEMKLDGIETRGVTWGDVLVRHIDLPPGVDFTPLFKGLPDDLCQCPHWGYVIERCYHRALRRRHRGDDRGGRGLLLAGRPHRLDRRRRDLPRVQPGRAAPSGARAPRRPARGISLTPASGPRYRLGERGNRRGGPSGAVRPVRGGARRARPARLAGQPTTPPPGPPTAALEPRHEAARLDLLADAAWWLGRLDECIEARERAYSRLRRAGRSAAGGPVRGVALRAPLLQGPARRSPGAWLRRARQPARTTTRTAPSTAPCCFARPRSVHGSGDLERAAGPRSRGRRARPPAAFGRRRGARRSRRSGGCSSTRATSPTGWHTSTRRCSSRSRAGSARTPPARSTAASSAPARSSATFAGRGVDRGHEPLGAAPSVRGVPRTVPRPPRVGAAVARCSGPTPSARRPLACEELARAQRAQRRRRIRGDRRDPPAPRRPRRRRGRVPHGRGTLRPARRPALALAAPGPATGSTRPRRSSAARSKPRRGTASRGPGCSRAFAQIAIAAGDTAAARHGRRRARVDRGRLRQPRSCWPRRRRRAAGCSSREPIRRRAPRCGGR